MDAFNTPSMDAFIRHNAGGLLRREGPGDPGHARMGRPAYPGHEEDPPGDDPGVERSPRNPGGHGHSRGGGPPAQHEANGAAQETEEEPRSEGGGHNPAAGKGQKKVDPGDGQGGCPTKEGGAGASCNAQESGAPEMPAEQGHPADPVGYEGVAGRNDQSTRTRSNGREVHGDDTVIILPREKAAEANPKEGRVGGRRRGGATAELAAIAAKEGGGRDHEKEAEDEKEAEGGCYSIHACSNIASIADANI
ncbi:circumsporozoite protein-like [Drosophila ananassae]|uniref:circumsporozoite protein-like n=1 Tax=Drosophila ananassae TaxID=7217 RepID=UPI001CFF6818|nr:circumsporozoite protein-like [Drosophila ananassae]